MDYANTCDADLNIGLTQIVIRLKQVALLAPRPPMGVFPRGTDAHPFRFPAVVEPSPSVYLDLK